MRHQQSLRAVERSKRLGRPHSFLLFCCPPFCSLGEIREGPGQGKDDSHMPYQWEPCGAPRVGEFMVIFSVNRHKPRQPCPGPGLLGQRRHLHLWGVAWPLVTCVTPE